MSLMSYQASAPGSLFIAGEHAVLVGYPALVAAIDKRIHVTLTPRTDRHIHIRSDSLGEYTATLDNLSIPIANEVANIPWIPPTSRGTSLLPTSRGLSAGSRETKLQTENRSFISGEYIAPWQFVLTAIAQWHQRDSIPTGFDLQITSEFSHKMGLGSSAAVSVALIAALAKWLKPEANKRDIFEHAFSVIKSVQGVGSGADVAASVFGGVIYYQLTPEITIDPLPVLLPIVLIYCGSKVPTPQVIAKVQQQQQQAPEDYERLFLQLGHYVEIASEACLMQDWRTLGDIFIQHQQVQTEMNLSTLVIDDIITSLLSCQDIMGAKISGSGLGDGVIGLGTIPDHFFPATQLQRDAQVEQVLVKLSEKGLL